MPTEYSSFRRELQRIREQPENASLASLVERLIAELEQERQQSRKRLDRFTENFRRLDQRVLNIENSRVFRLLQRATAVARVWRRRTSAHSAAEPPGRKDAYLKWIENEAAQAPARETIADAARRFTYRPTISILMHAERPERDWLERAVGAVRQQSWKDWELCVGDDACAEPWVSEFLAAQAEIDSRIRPVRSEQPMGPASSLNRAGILASGEYLALLGQHDVLSPDALFRVVEALQEQRHELLYGDEDQLDDAGTRRDPIFKPAWSPDLLTSSMYLGTFLVVSRIAMERLEWLSSDSSSAHAYDLALRIAEVRASVRHIARVLVHCGPRGNCAEAERRALSAALARREQQAAVADGGRPGVFRVRRRIKGAPLVTIVICSRTPRLLGACLQALEQRTAYPVRETVVIEHRNGEDAAMERLLTRSHCVRVTHEGPFDFAAMNNRGVEAASGEIIILMNDDVEPLSADWLNELIAHVQQPRTGIAGPRLLYPYGAIQHAGIAVGIMDGAGHPNRGGFESPAWPWSGMTRNVSAVTGACMAVRRAVFEELGGLDRAFPVNYNDVDFCLRARRAGYEIIYEPAAVLRHYESRTRPCGTTWHERELFHERWGTLLEQGDPYYSPNLTRSREDCSFRDA